MIDFVQKRKIFFTISICIVAIAILGSLILGVSLDIQFKGGSIMTYSYTGEISTEDFTAAVQEVLGTDLTVTAGSDINTGLSNYTITQTKATGVDSDLQTRLLEKLTTTFADNNIETISLNVVSPTIGKDFMVKALVAVAFASLVMILYIGIRFRKMNGWSAGVFAVVALLHDVIVVYATFVLCGIPLNNNFIAVILTILGYSINDTIVIYDRIRENAKTYGNKMPLDTLVNTSINQSLRRTLNTTITTIIAMVCVTVVALIYHVDSIVSFSFPIIIGMISGSYSSLCLTGTLWYSWESRKGKKTK